MVARDLFTAYETGMQGLLAHLGQAHPHYQDALLFQTRLLENIGKARRYADTETLRHERAQIVEQINALALEVGGPTLTIDAAAAGAAPGGPVQTITAQAGATISQVTQIGGDQRLVDTGGGDYAERDIYKGVHYHLGELRPREVDPETLTAALARLADLPLDRIPDPVPLPHGSRMPLSRNPLFVGRAADLKQLAVALKGGGTAAIGQVAAATGLGGIGKTNLATEWVHRYGQYFAGGVFWLSFADPASVPAEVAACGALGLVERPDYGRLKLDEQIPLVLAAWQSALPRLLVFDNCEDEGLLAQWRPPHGGCRVLVTSRRGQWDAALGVQALPLGVLARDESVALLRKFVADLSDTDANAIADELGDLPLALHLAGSFLAQYGRVVTPQAYLEQVRNPKVLDHPSLQGRGARLSPTGHDLHVWRTFRLSYERLNADDATDALALALLARAACLAPGKPIPRDLVLATLDLPDDDFEAHLQAEDALGRLVGLGLLETEAGGALRLHRLLVAFVQVVGADAEAQGAVERVLQRAMDARLDQAKYFGAMTTLHAHVLHVTHIALERADADAARLANKAGYYLHQIGDYATAHPLYVYALTVTDRVLGSYHPSTGVMYGNLGLLSKDMEDYGAARSHCERALRIHQQMLGSDHPTTAQSLNNLGLVLQAMGDFAGARPYYERALTIRNQVLGPKDPCTATSLNNLGTLLQVMGDLTEARSYLERALEIREQVLGLEHRDTAQSLNNMGMLLKAQGDVLGAQRYLERAVGVWEKAVGPNHPETAIALNNLAEMLQDRGELARVRSSLERVLEIWIETLGHMHLRIPQTMLALAKLCYAQGDLVATWRYSEQSMVLYEQMLGPQHPATALSLWWMGVVLRDEGKLPEAADYLRRAVAVFAAKLGPEHQRTQGARQWLAGVEERVSG